MTHCEYIKGKLQKLVLLVYPDFNEIFIIHAEASPKAIGYTLTQKHHGKIRPMMFGRRVQTDIERKHATRDRTLLACFYVLKKSETYVLGHEYIIHANHKPMLSQSYMV